MQFGHGIADFRTVLYGSWGAFTDKEHALHNSEWECSGEDLVSFGSGLNKRQFVEKPAMNGL